MKMKQFYLLVLSLLILLFLVTKNSSAQNVAPIQETLEATVEKILEEKKIKPAGAQSIQIYQKLELLVTKGSLKDKQIIIESGNLPLANLQKYEIGDKVVVVYSKDLKGKNTFYISDFIRREPLLWLFIIFIILTVYIARRRGLMSILGMACSFLIIFFYILPNISAGSDPVQIAIIGSLFIIPITFYFSHGLNKKTSVAIIGTVISLIITGFLANIFVNLAKLTGFSSEEAGFLQFTKQGTINMKGLLLAGIIIGVLGVLDDITISQSAIVFQLKEINNKLKFGELYNRAMNVGQDHIASMVNTLVLVYTGAALPLLILFINNPQPFSEIINYEIIADEVVRTMVGSIGLILSVPITTFIASIIALKNDQ